ncbi:MAG: argininosuccinate synthase [Candidatus Wallbacteria bacterium]|nr:argininosuccinate synthase [Candidatus Wallbacteria bacterium]
MRKIDRYGDLSGRTVVLAFSGGLDTSFCVTYLQEVYGARVMTVTVDTGGFGAEELARIERRSAALGAAAGHRTLDATQALYREFLAPLIRGNVLRGGVYPLSVSAERVLQAREVASLALRSGAAAVVHGSTGAGNDQIRFDTALAVLAPELPCLTPIRDLGAGREEETAFLESRGIPVEKKTTAYSINEGLWGTTIGGRETHGSWEEVPEHLYPGATPAQAPAQGRSLVLGFERGLPVAIDGESMDGVTLIRRLNALGLEHAIGRGVHVGDTILGIKGRVAFSAPGPHAILRAHRELEKLVLTGWQAFWKDQVSAFYGQLLHGGQYFDPVMRDIEAMLESSQARVRGEVRVKLCRGVLDVTGARSPHSMMDPRVAVYGEGMKLWTGDEARGFAKIYGIPPVLWARAGKEDE